MTTTTPEPEGGRPATLDRIWAGWRSAYVAEASAGANLVGEGTVFTRILAAIDRGELTDETAYVLHRGEAVFAILNAYPYGTGHLLVLPYREVGALADLTDAEAAELWAVVRDGVAAVGSSQASRRRSQAGRAASSQ